MTTLTATFRVMGADLDPERVSQLLKLSPDHSHRRGNPHFGNSGRRYSDFSEGIWMLKSTLPDTSPLDDHLASLLEKLQGRGGTLQDLRSQGFRTDVFIGVFGEETGNLGFSISSYTLKALGDLGLTLELDVYD